MEKNLEIAALVAKAKTGCEEAMGDLILFVEKPLMRFLFHLTGSEQQAQDLSQETLVRVLTKIGQLKDNGGFLSWVFQVARNQFLDDIRKNKRIVVVEEVEEQEDFVSDPDREEILSIRTVLSQLELAEREVLILVDMEGYSYQEAGDILKISEAAVRSRIHRARSVFIRDFNELTEPPKKDASE